VRVFLRSSLRRCASNCDILIIGPAGLHRRQSMASRDLRICWAGISARTARVTLPLLRLAALALIICLLNRPVRTHTVASAVSLTPCATREDRRTLFPGYERANIKIFVFAAGWRVSGLAAPMFALQVGFHVAPLWSVRSHPSKWLFSVRWAGAFSLIRRGLMARCWSTWPRPCWSETFRTGGIGVHGCALFIEWCCFFRQGLGRAIYADLRPARRSNKLLRRQSKKPR